MTARSNTLTQLIREKIKKDNGLISFASFMELALYHPEFGYYNAEGFDLGQHGDFTTAPEISPLFAKCFSKQCQQLFHYLETGNILELGAGTGRFASDVLLELERLGCLPEHYYIYEISIRLREKQQSFLKSTCQNLFNRITWLDKLPENFVGIIIANEVLDALPVHCFRIENNGIKERCVAWNKDQFVWKITSPLSHELTEKAMKIREQYEFYDCYESEINLRLPQFLQAVANALKQGVILFSDYGYGQRKYYHPERNKGTLTCFYQHRRHNNPLIYPGLQDITSHVNFTTVIESASESGCTLEGYTSQTAFLLACGLMELAAEEEKNLSPADEFKLHQAIKLLTLPTEMGERVKVMALGKNMDIPLLGFRLQDRRREL